MMAERVLADLCAATGLRYAILRYFNVAGADADARIGEATPDNSHLVKVACETALGCGPAMRINGTDYPTPDGTCVRDYVHVDDLARAHVEALAHLRRRRRLVHRQLRLRPRLQRPRGAGRRAADHGRGVPDRGGAAPAGRSRRCWSRTAARIQALLGWRPRHDDLDYIVATAWRWEQRLRETERELGRKAS